MSQQPASTLSPESPDDELVRLRRENAALRALVIDQAALIEQLRQRLQELEARLAKDSHNSSKPPSSDPPFKKPPPKSLRMNHGRKPGGQKQHPGATLELVAQPDHHVTLPLSGACACGQDLSELAATPLPERRQVTELVIRREITEYRTVAGTCPCGRGHRSAFPDAVRAPVQYGPGVSAFAVFLTQFHHLPYQRTADLLASVAGMALSPGTIYTLVQEAAARLAAPVAAIGEALVKQTVAHADETGVRIGGKLHWLHVLSATCLTFFAVHAQRGRQALAAIGLLARFRGMLVHDHWSAYAGYDCTHAYCNAHHLRELIAMAETYPRHRWPPALIDLLCEANAATKLARAAGFAALPSLMVEDFCTRYDAILAAAIRQHPRAVRPPGQRRRVKQTPAYNLITRLQAHRDAVLRFITDLQVPFDNNLAERDIRMPKLKHKVSGGFRALAGAQAFATIRSYLSTLQKQSIDVYQALVLTFQGQPPMPRLD